MFDNGVLEPGDTIGIIGGGQLGRMLAMAAARLGLRTVILEPQEDCPAAHVANYHVVGAYDDLDSLNELAEYCHIITYEFENVPVASCKLLEEKLTIRPDSHALEMTQDRMVEKQFLNDNDIETAPWFEINNADELYETLKKNGRRGVLKTRRMGYDGKGQVMFTGANDPTPADAIKTAGSKSCILEGLVEFEREISVIAARNHDGDIVHYDPVENEHRDGILRTSKVPAHASKTISKKAIAITADILKALDYVGVIAVEFFIGRNGKLLVNEIAPRVHNSGHWTEAACVVSQFENHIRAVAGWPLAQPRRHSNCTMENLIGKDVEKWQTTVQKKDTVLHLYGKAETRPGRKMGHVTKLTGRPA